MTTELTRPGGISEDQVALVKRTICAGSTDDELQLFVQTANRLGLDPFARQVFAVKRWDSRANREVMSIQVSIDGFRLIAERTKKYAGQLGPFWTGDGKTWVDVWLDTAPPKAARVGVMRHDFKEPIFAVATWDQYKQEGKNGLTPMWKRMGPLMLAKCAESLALRRAFPQELSGAYTDAEMDQAAPDDYTPPARVVTEAPERIREEAPQDHPKAHAPSAVAGAPSASVAATPATGTRPPSDLDSDWKAPPGGAPKPRTAADVKPTGGPITPEQIKCIHTLLTRIGNVTDEAYRKGVAVYRQADGSRCIDPSTGLGTSKLLSKDQASHLIGRFEDKAARQEQRAGAGVDIGAVDLAAPLALPPTVANLLPLVTEDDDVTPGATWLTSRFGVDSVAALDKTEAETALALLLAFKQGPDKYEEAETRARAAGKVR